MSYLDRLRTLRYISPSGKEFTAEFNDLERAGGKKAAVHEYPQQDIAEVQDLGQSAMRFKLAIYFSGPDYDQTADAFYAALGEHGAGRLMHPRWGDFPVLALTFTQTEGFVENLGRATFEVEFIHAPTVQAPAPTAQTATGTARGVKSKTQYPTSTASTSAAIGAASVATGSAAAEAAAEAFGDPGLDEKAEIKKGVDQTLREWRTRALSVVGQTREISQNLTAKITAVQNDIEGLMRSPLDFAQAIQEIIMIPSDATVSTLRLMSAYADTAGALFRDISTAPERIAASVSQAAVAAYTAVLLMLGITKAASSSGAGTGFSSRSEALAAHDLVASSYRRTIEAIEAFEETSGHVSAPEVLAALADVTAQTKAYLLEASFNLRAERRVVTDGDATPLELVFRFYGDLARLDEFCDLNHLQGDRILIVPAGTEVRYYAE